MRTPTLIMMALSLIAKAETARADAYEAACERATKAERAGDVKSAIALLEAGVQSFPQDYAIAELLGDTRFRARDFRGAIAAYRAALAVAPAAATSRVSLVAALVEDGNCSVASDEAGRVTKSPSRELVAQVLAPCRPKPLALTLSLAGNESLFPSHPWKSSGTGGTVAATATLFGRVTLGGAYRFTHFDTKPSSSLAAFNQHEGYADLALNTETVGLALHGAVIVDGTGTLGTSKHAGFTFRYSALGDLILHGYASVYPDTTVLRAAPEWRLHVAGPFYVQPGFALQTASGNTYATATLGLSLVWQGLSVWAGGKYGKEFRPAYLDAHVVYDISEDVLYGGWAGVRLHITGPVSATATYAFDRVERTDSLTPSQSSSHTFSLGPSFEF